MLEDRIVGALREEGLIRSEMPWHLRGSAAAGALAMLLAIFLWAALSASPPIEKGEKYMLALYSGPTYRHPPVGDARARAEEYGRWAAEHREGAAVVTGGEELGETIAALGQPAPGGGEIAGFFLVRAESQADAVALARSSPHLRHGGTIVVREILD